MHACVRVWLRVVACGCVSPQMGIFTRSLAGLYPRVTRGLAEFTHGQPAGTIAKAEGGAWMSGGNDARSINGVHPAHCTCHACFKLQEAAKADKEAAKAARLQQAREKALAKDAERRWAAGPQSSSEYFDGESC